MKKKYQYLNIKVTPQTRKQTISQVSPNHLKIKLKSPAKNNQANEELIKLLAKHLNIKKSQITIVAGKTNREKLIKIKINNFT